MGRETLETYRTGAKRQSPVADCSRDCTTVSSTSQLSGPFCGSLAALRRPCRSPSEDGQHAVRTVQGSASMLIQICAGHGSKSRFSENGMLIGSGPGHHPSLNFFPSWSFTPEHNGPANEALAEGARGFDGVGGHLQAGPSGPWRGNTFEFTHQLSRKVNVCRSQVLLQVTDGRSPWDQKNVGRSIQEPGKCHLQRGGTKTFGHR